MEISIGTRTVNITETILTRKVEFYLLLYAVMECKNGLRHRDENGKTLPAIIYSDGNRHWYKNGKRRRDDRDENGKLLPASI